MIIMEKSERRIYLIIDQCIDDWGVHHTDYAACASMDMAKEKLSEDRRASTEIISSSIREISLYEVDEKYSDN